MSLMAKLSEGQGDASIPSLINTLIGTTGGSPTGEVQQPTSNVPFNPDTSPLLSIIPKNATATDAPTQPVRSSGALTGGFGLPDIGVAALDAFLGIKEPTVLERSQRQVLESLPPEQRDQAAMMSMNIKNVSPGAPELLNHLVTIYSPFSTPDEQQGAIKAVAEGSFNGKWSPMDIAQMEPLAMQNVNTDVRAQNNMANQGFREKKWGQEYTLETSKIFNAYDLKTKEIDQRGDMFDQKMKHEYTKERDLMLRARVKAQEDFRWRNQLIYQNDQKLAAMMQLGRTKAAISLADSNIKLIHNRKEDVFKQLQMLSSAKYLPDDVKKSSYNSLYSQYKGLESQEQEAIIFRDALFKDDQGIENLSKGIVGNYVQGGGGYNPQQYAGGGTPTGTPALTKEQAEEEEMRKPASDLEKGGDYAFYTDPYGRPFKVPKHAQNLEKKQTGMSLVDQPKTYFAPSYEIKKGKEQQTQKEVFDGIQTGKFKTEIDKNGRTIVYDKQGKVMGYIRTQIIPGVESGMSVGSKYGLVLTKDANGEPSIMVPGSQGDQKRGIYLEIERPISKEEWEERNKKIKMSQGLSNFIASPFGVSDIGGETIQRGTGYQIVDKVVPYKVATIDRSLIAGLLNQGYTPDRIAIIILDSLERAGKVGIQNKQDRDAVRVFIQNLVRKLSSPPTKVLQ